MGARSFKRFVGRKTSILTVENQKRGSTLCRDDNYRPIILMEELPLGEFYDVEIIDSEYGFMTAILAWCNSKILIHCFFCKIMPKEFKAFIKGQPVKKIIDPKTGQEKWVPIESESWTQPFYPVFFLVFHLF